MVVSSNFLFSPWKLGKMNPIWRSYVSNGLVQPPTRIWFKTLPWDAFFQTLTRQSRMLRTDGACRMLPGIFFRWSFCMESSPHCHHAEARFLLDVLFKAIWILENERIRIWLEHHLAVLGHVICFFLLSSKVDPLSGGFGAEVRRIFWNLMCKEWSWWYCQESTLYFLYHL